MLVAILFRGCYVARAYGDADITSTNDQPRPLLVIVAEDNDDLRAVMPPLIDEAGDLCCVGTTDTLSEVAALIERHGADIAVLDVELRDGSALKAAPGTVPPVSGDPVPDP